MYSYAFKPNAVKELKRLPIEIQKRIIKKLDYFTSSNNPLVFAEALVNYEIGQYRFRVGDYRIIIDLQDELIIILSIGHRREIYRR